MSEQRIPLLVIGGFLGAGKTTLLNRWLSTAHGRRLAVLVNDFGAVNVDASLIAAMAADTVALSNGCVCCSIGDDLTAALIRLLDKQPPYDAIIVEASGVSDPWRIAQLAQADPTLELAGVVVLVDSAALPEQSRDPRLADTLSRQLAAADLVVLNKADLARDDELAATQAWVASHAPDAPRLVTTEGDVSLQGLLDSADVRPSPPLQGMRQHCDTHQPHAHADNHEHEHAHSTPEGHDHAHDHQFESVVLHPTRHLTPEAWRTCVTAMPAGVLRLKGWVLDDIGTRWILQFAGRHTTLRRATLDALGGDAPWPSGNQAPHDAMLVAIGLRGHLPIAALRTRFEGTQAA